MANISFFEGLPTYDWQDLLKTVIATGEFNDTTGAPLTELRLIAGSAELVLMGVGLAADGVRNMTDGTITSISLVSNAPSPNTVIFTEGGFFSPPGFALFQAMLESASLPGPTLPHGSTIDLASLDGSNGFVFAGAEPNDYAGGAIARAGDINGDGFTDFVIGATGAGPKGPEYSEYFGAAYVVFGDDGGFPPSLDPLDLDGTNGFRVPGLAAGDIAGYAVGTAGDINGDGIDDLVVSAAGAGATDNPGHTYVVFGKTSGWTADFDVATLNGSNGFRLVGGDEDRAATSIAAGDVNGDGISDLIVGGQSGETYAGIAYVVFGRDTDGGDDPFAASVDLAGLDGTDGFMLPGISGNYSTGNGVSVGDINGDQIDDIVVSASGAADGRGETYVVFGTDAGFPGSFDLAGLSSGDGSNGFVVRGESQYDRSSLSIASGGDFNGDGFDDLLIGAPYADRGGYGYYGYDVGRVYVVFGKEDGFDPVIDLYDLGASDGFWITGTEDYEQLGMSVASAGDFNGDGFDDILLSAAVASSGYNGRTHLIFGSPSGFGGPFDLSSIDGVNGLRIEGLDGDRAWKVSGLGDFNNDGFDDIAIGARRANDDAGAAYVIFGAAQAFNADLRAVFFAEPLFIVGSDDPEELIGGDGDDNIQGGAGDDTIYGGAGYDQLSGGDDNDTIYGGDGNGANLDGGDGDDILYGGNSGSGYISSRGNDQIHSGAGGDGLYYDAPDSTHGLIVNFSGSIQLGLDPGEIRDNYGDVDQIFGIGNIGKIDATEFADQFFSGDDGFITYVGWGGNDTFTYTGTAPLEFVGGEGADTFVLGDDGELTLHYRYEPSLREDFDPENDIWGQGDWSAEHGVIVNLSAENLVGVSITNFGPTTVFANTAVDTYGDIDTFVAATGGLVHVTGTDAQDYMRGSDNPDVDERFDGEGGNDLLFGGDGYDELYGGDGEDTLDGGSGDDYIDGGDDDDTIDGGDGSDNLRGGAGNDTLTGGGVSDSNSDFFTGGRGNDLMYGGVNANEFNRVQYNVETDWGDEDSGTHGVILNLSGDEVTYDIGSGDQSVAAGQALDSYGDTDTLVNIQNADGTQYRDVLIGNELDNDLAGGAGDDVIVGNGGFDGFVGGAGDDILDGGNNFDEVKYRAEQFDHGEDPFEGVIVNLGTDTLTDESLEALLLGLGVVVDVVEDFSILSGHAKDTFGDDDTLIGIENVIGTDEADYIVGGLGENFMNGYAGDDILIGGGAGDTSADFFVGGEGDDIIVGGVNANEFNRVVYDGETDWGDFRDDDPHGVIVNLSAGQITHDIGFGLGNITVDAGQAFDSYGDTDTLINIQNANGTQYRDVLVGGAENNDFRGNGDDDIIDGGGGFNIATYGVTLTYTISQQDIVWATDHWEVSAGLEGTDTLTNIAIVEHAGGRFLLIGDGGFADFAAAFAAATQEGDTIVYAVAPVSITLDAPDDDEDHNIVIPYDVPVNITVGNGNNNITTGSGDDQIVTGDGDNVIKTGGGNDTVITGTGTNVIIAGSGNGDDLYDGTAGDATIEYPSATNPITVDLRLLNREDVVLSGADDAGPNPDTVGDLLVLNAHLATKPVAIAYGDDIGVDVLIGIEDVTGGQGADTFIMNVADPINNVFDGLTGADTADYSEATTAIAIVRTGAGQHSVTATGLGTDTVTSFEIFLTGSGQDTFTTTAVEFVALTEIDLGGGTDALTVQVDGVFDFSTHALPTLTDIETKELEGSANNDTVTLTQSQFGAFTAIDLGAATTGDALTIKTNGAFTYTGATVANIESVTIDDDGVGHALTGSSGVESINGNGGDDTITGGGGNDAIEGGAGTGDTAVYTGAWLNYGIATVSGTTTITDNRGSSPDGTDTVTNVEQFTFSNGTFAVGLIVNDAPTNIALSASTVLENAATNTVIGALSSTDADTALGDTAAYSIVDSAGGRFGISGGNLVVANGALLDFEASTSHVVTVKVTDGKGLTFDKALTITVGNVNDNAPVITSAAAASVVENSPASTVVYDANGSDADGNAITWSLGGTDAARFSINAATGEVRFVASPDFEAPADSGGNNVYDILVIASDGVNASNLGVAISVTNQDESVSPPTKGPDIIVGTSAGETINGGLGNDILTGNGGADDFVFDSKLNKKNNVDIITDFEVGVDKIELDKSIFKKLKVGELSSKVFTSGKVAKDDRVIYNKNTGDVSYDADGKGGTKAIKFLTLEGSPDNLSAKDFMVIA